MMMKGAGYVSRRILRVAFEAMVFAQHVCGCVVTHQNHQDTKIKAGQAHRTVAQGQQNATGRGIYPAFR
jgi:predicted adenine nucleotide alpha hydrolase (AANH) superfamily ATPase